jgi:hypothetical protein
MAFHGVCVMLVLLMTAGEAGRLLAFYGGYIYEGQYSLN